MFDMNQLECHVNSVSTNSENMGAGGETKLGMSIYVEFLGTNELLDKFDTKLRPALYEKAANDAQEDLTNHLPALKFKLSKPLCWPYVGSGYTAGIQTVLDLAEAINLEDCKVDKFQFAVQDEGRVGYKLRLYVHPTLEQVGPLCALEKHDIKLTLTPPKISEQQPPAESEEPSAQGDLLDTAPPETGDDVLYPRAVAALRATGNPTASALQAELKIGFNHAAQLLSRMFDDGIIAKNDDGEYFVVAEAAA
jgi:hypothetical protein